MKNIFLFIAILISLSIFGQALEGFGAKAVGGSNSSTIYHVTSLKGSGPGSLSYGIGSNRTIVFDVDGIIVGVPGTVVGRYDIIGVSYMTIDANGHDVTIDNNNAGDAISFDGPNTHHCILKGIHVTDAGGDGINVIDGAHDILITNCTSWGNRDGNIDIAADNSGQTINVTVQYSILGNGGPGWSGEMLITGRNVSVHHNLFSPATAGEVGERNPFVHCNYSPVGSPNADFRNNVVWKWGRQGGTGSGYGSGVDYKATANIVNNYYYSSADPGRAVDLDADPTAGSGAKAYAAGNVSGNAGVNPNSKSNNSEFAIAADYAIAMQDACTAAQLVLAQAGPSKRNSIDAGFIGAVILTNCSGPINSAPIANAGPDASITLPTNSILLSGTGTDSDGSIVSYAWNQVSGPSTSTISNASGASTMVTALAQGTYVFKLTVTDNGGATGSDQVSIVVNAAPNISPTVDAGNDQTITFPINNVTITGTATDPDGAIASYLWTKVSGAGGTIANANTATASMLGLTPGTYIYSLKVTDNKGATATDNVIVNVLQAPPSAIVPLYMIQVVTYSDSTKVVLPPIKF